MATITSVVFEIDGEIITIGGVEGSPVPVVIGTGLSVPTWGKSPTAQRVGETTILKGHIARGVGDLIPGAVLLTAGSWNTGDVVVATSDSGLVTLNTVGNTLVFGQILTGSAPLWISLDGVGVDAS